MVVKGHPVADNKVFIEGHNGDCYARIYRLVWDVLAYVVYVIAKSGIVTCGVVSTLYASLLDGNVRTSVQTALRVFYNSGKVHRL